MLAKSAAATSLARWQTGIQATFEAELSITLFRSHMLRDLQQHRAESSSVLLRNLTASIGVVSTQVIGASQTIFTDLTLLLGIFVTLVALIPVLAVAFAAFFVAVVVGYFRVIGPVIRTASENDQHLYLSTLRLMQEASRGIKTVMAYDVTDTVISDYEVKRRGLSKAHRTMYFTQRLPQFYLEVCLVLAAGAAVLLYRTLAGGESAATVLVLLVAAMLRALPSISRLMTSFSALRGGAPAARNLVAASNALKSLPEERPLGAAHGGGAAADRALSASLRLVDVTMTYRGAAAPALSHVTLTIDPGASVGIVGSSGAGKTTLVDVLLGLLSPECGDVALGELHLSGTTASSWRRRVGYVPQEIFLLDDTIRANIEFFRPPADSDDDLWKALAGARLDDFVRDLPDGLDSLVGEDGARISGGQRQRLGIARALLTNPSILIFDEATSALDSRTEADVMKAILGLSGSLTLIIVAHRLPTVKECDQIVVLDQGRVVEVGEFAELAGRAGIFSDMLSHFAVGRES
jgi:ATP-binding cassette subfamily C protein